MAAWRIIRPVNLVVLVVLFWLIKLLVLSPAEKVFHLQLTLSDAAYIWLILSCLLITAGGNIINDIIDVQIDLINVPDRVVIGKHISEKTGYIWYITCSSLGLLAGYLLANSLHMPVLASVHVLAVTSLYLYAQSWKKVPVVGNVMVAALSALAVLLPFIFEPSIYRLHRPADYYAAIQIWRTAWVLALFAFLVSLAREVVKDTSDRLGDEQNGVKSIAVQWGREAAQGTVMAILCTTMVLLLILVLLTWQQNAYDAVVPLMLLVPFVYNGILLAMVFKKFSDHTVSYHLKVFMLVGMCVVCLSHYLNFI